MLRFALAFAGLVVGEHRVTGAQAREISPDAEEIYIWKSTGDTRCSAGRIEERWGYYECVGSSCTPLYFEWRPTAQTC